MPWPVSEDGGCHLTWLWRWLQVGSLLKTSLLSPPSHLSSGYALICHMLRCHQVAWLELVHSRWRWPGREPWDDAGKLEISCWSTARLRLASSMLEKTFLGSNPWWMLLTSLGTDGASEGLTGKLPGSYLWGKLLDILGNWLRYPWNLLRSFPWGCLWKLLGMSSTGYVLYQMCSVWCEIKIWRNHTRTRKKVFFLAASILKPSLAKEKCLQNLSPVSGAGQGSLGARRLKIGNCNSIHVKTLLLLIFIVARLKS